MILPAVKFVVFSLAPFLLLLWSTSPDLWGKISSSAWLVGNDPSSLWDLPSILLFSGEAVVKSLTCDDLDLDTKDHTSLASERDVFPTPPLTSAATSNPVPLVLPMVSVTVGFIMPGIVRPSKKARKAGIPVSKLTKLTDLNQMVDQKWVTAAPVCQLKPAPPCKLMLINWRNMRVTRYKLINQHGHQKLVIQGFFATWTRYLLEDAKEIGDQDSGELSPPKFTQ
ncbi:hypothetical protein DSO57_1008156 [Entomophthora muscae]|uniref:Uncharacterized protein n=1 Tax=Entomophthora muscae TaxID=34485 RepID=A0ACC2T748_9FUNG|nr:hypothetical protein DSO57_1008156 [Entomophthora muscae]